MDNPISVLPIVGNPRPQSRTHAVATTLAAEIARALGGRAAEPVDLALLGPKVLAHPDADADGAVARVLAADVIVVVSPTYKATYTGLLKAFLDRIGSGALNGAPAVPVLLGGAPDHALAVDVHLTPLLLELGAGIPVRGLFVLESALDDFPAAAAAWADAAAPALRR